MLEFPLFEVTNGILAMFSLLIVVIIGRYLYNEIGNSSTLAFKLALAMLVVFIGETLLRGWVWHIWTLRNSGEPYIRIKDVWYIPATFGAVTSIGMFYLIWVIVPTNCKPWNWIFMPLLAIVIVILNIYYDFI